MYINLFDHFQDYIKVFVWPGRGTNKLYSDQIKVRNSSNTQEVV